MFLSNLNLEQKQAFLGLAHQFISADGQLAPQEEAMLGAMKTEMGLSEHEKPISAELHNLLKPFDSKYARASVLLEIVGLGYSDNNFHPEESQIVQTIAQNFEISKEEVRQMENWVIRQIMLAKEATQFFE